MPARCVIMGLLLTFQLAIATTAQAVVVQLQGSGRVVYGKLIQLTPELLEVDQVSVQGKVNRLEFSRAEIAKLTLHVSDQRLSELDPQQAEGYLQYAEELFAHRDDPDAQQTASRLYLIAGHLNEKQFGQRALLQLAVLARTEQEEKRFRAMHHLLRVQQGNATQEIAARLNATFLESSAVDRALLCLRSLRGGDRRQALAQLDRLEVRHALNRFHGELTAAQLQQLAYGECDSCVDGRTTCQRCMGRGDVMTAQGKLACAPCQASGLISCSVCRGRDFFTRPNNEVLRKLLALELTILGEREKLVDGQSNQAIVKEDFRNWIYAQQNGERAILELDWSNLTEIDPQQSVYVGDRWVKP